jgi:hypothetical protein
MSVLNEEYVKNSFAQAKGWFASKRFTIYLYCVAIATFIWFLMKFSGSYSTQLPVQVSFSSPLTQWYVVDDQATIAVDVKGFGFSIMWHRFSGISEINIDVSEFEIKGTEEDPFVVVPTDFLLNKIEKLFSEDESIDGIYPNVLKVELSHAITKKVPVRSRLKVIPANGYKISNRLTLNPEKIELAGPAYILSDIKFINTKIDTLRDLKASSEVSLSLDADSLNEWIMNEKIILMNIEVDEFTSGSIDVKVQPKLNDPNTLIKVLPTKVKVFYQVGLKDYQLVNEDLFKAYVSFPIEGEAPSKLKVSLEDIPDFVEVTRIDPPFVEYLLTKVN